METHATPHASVMTGTEHEAAVQGDGSLVAVPDGVEAGRVVMWSMEGDVSYDELHDVWLEEGGAEGDLPARTSAAAALRHAVNGIGAEKNLLVRPVGTGWAMVAEMEVTPDGAPVRTQASGRRTSRKAKAAATPKDVALEAPEGGAPVDPAPAQETVPVRRGVQVETPTESLTHSTLATVELDSDGIDVTVTTLDAALGNLIRERFLYHLSVLTPRELAYWIPARIFALDGVALRERGGVYFVPKPGVPGWQRVVRALRVVSAHKLYGIPAMPVADAAAAFLDAMSAEADGFAARAYADLPSLGKRGRSTRVQEVQHLVAKVGRYEAMFGSGRLQRVRDALTKLELACTMSTVLDDTIQP